jgi:hypothetical protein
MTKGGLFVKKKPPMHVVSVEMGIGLQSKAAAHQIQKSTWWVPRF